MIKAQQHVASTSFEVAVVLQISFVNSKLASVPFPPLFHSHCVAFQRSFLNSALKGRVNSIQVNISKSKKVLLS